MNWLIKNPIGSFLISIVVATISVLLLFKILSCVGLDEGEELLTPLSIIGSAIMFTLNWLVKVQEQRRLDKSSLTDNNIKLMRELGDMIYEINGGEGSKKIYITKQIALIYGLAELAKKHTIISMPARKSLEDIARRAKIVENGLPLYSAANDALDQIQRSPKVID